MISPATYQQRVEYNTRLAEAAIDENGMVGLINIIGKIYTFDSEPNEVHITKLIRSVYDIIPSLMMGYLPCLDLHGADAIELVDDKFVEIEFKWTTVKSDPFWVTEKKTIYAGTADTTTRRASFRSYISGTFQIHTDECANSKKRKTLLLVSDSTLQLPIVLDIFELDAETTHHFLSGNNNQGHKRESVKRYIKLGTFMKRGVSVKHKSLVDDGIRFEDYEELLRNNLPTLSDRKAGVRYYPSYIDLLLLMAQKHNIEIVTTTNAC